MRIISYRRDIFLPCSTASSRYIHGSTWSCYRDLIEIGKNYFGIRISPGAHPVKYTHFVNLIPVGRKAILHYAL